MTKAARDKDRALAHSAENGVEADVAAAQADEDAAMADAEEAEAFGSKTIVIHPGSQNLRIGLATDALPKTIPMVIARRSSRSESEDNDGEPRPKRLKVDNGDGGDDDNDDDDDDDAEPEKWFGEEVRAAMSCKLGD